MKVVNLCKRISLNTSLFFNKRFLCNTNDSILSPVKLAFQNVKPDKPNNKPPILIFHGLFGNKNNWKSLSKPIADETGREVFLFDLRNHGDSPHVDGKLSNLTAMAYDIKLFIDDNNYDKACLIGHSLGGRVVMQFAFLFEERVEKLIPVDIGPKSIIKDSFFLSPIFPDELAESISNLRPNITLSEARKKADENLEGIILDNFIRGFFLMNLTKTESGEIKWKYNLKGIKEMLSCDYINQLKYDKPYDGEVMILHGEKSPYVRLNDYNDIRKVFHKVIFKSINDTGHYLHIEKPNKVLNRLVNFINNKY